MSYLIENELHTVTEGQYRDNLFIIPIYAPFYVDDFNIIYTLNGVSRPLVEDVDFSFTLSYVTGTRTTGKPCYGGVTLHNLNPSGILSFTYKPLVPDREPNRLEVLTLLADKAYNPRTTIWDILDTPGIYNPSEHRHEYEDFKGQEEVIQTLNLIRDAIVANSSLTREALESFLINLGTESLSAFLRKEGDRMNGPLLLARDPIDPMEATTRSFIEQHFVSNSNLTALLSNYTNNAELSISLDSKVSKSGSTMTGPLTLNAPPSQDMHAANKSYVDSKLSGIQEELDLIRNSIGDVQGEFISRSEVEGMIGEVLMRLTHRVER